MKLSIQYKNNDITQSLIKNNTENGIITIPKSYYSTLPSSIIINGEDYSNQSDIFIDTDTNIVYTEYPNHLEKLLPKVVILIICHYSEINMMMLDELRRKIYKNHRIQYYIVASRFSITNPKEIELEDDIIFVNQTETYFNILNKTLKAMEYIDKVLQLKYDFLIRTNISTVINIPRLLSELSQIPKNNISIGGKKMQINWTCPGYGIDDNRYKGRWFIQGTSIIFSKDVCQNIIKNQHKIEKTIVDDISLFMYLSNFNKAAYDSVNKYAISFYECSQNLDELHTIPRNFAFYRNKSDNMRDDDIMRIRFLCNILEETIDEH